MNTFLLSWNSKRWEWKAADLAATILEVQAKGGSEERWSCGNRRALPRGSRFFLIRLGPKPRGLIGSGTTISEPRLGPHWDRAQTKLALYVDIRFDFLAREPLVLWKDLVKGPLGSFSWGIQASGVALPDAIAVPLEQLWSRRVAGDEPLIPDEIPDEMDFAEGSRKQITVNAYERNPQARAACLAHFGYQCSVCDILLEEKYGPIAADFVHVHHTVPLADLPSNYRVSPKRDLRPVCPTCHAILHRRRPPLSIPAARRLLRRAQ